MRMWTILGTVTMSLLGLAEVAKPQNTCSKACMGSLSLHEIRRNATSVKYEIAFWEQAGNSSV